MCLALWAKWCYAAQKEMSLSISNVIGEKRYLEDSVKELLTRKSIQLDSIELRRGNEHYKLCDIVSFPCIVIYLPSVQEKICGSCLIFAMDEAQKHLEDFFRNKQVCIISLGDNPEMKERIYKKKIFVTDQPLIDVPKTYMPYYFIVNNEGDISHLFCPNSAFKNYTSVYWEKIKSMISSSPCEVQ